ncbi:hypothetical protein CEXT_601071 [Caerostris extrusa]|uniref:Uncharacterized protein n=1 Tax=Caerostris extrusa TaxID=172846 RepID=A0AAV4QSE8_CAEEX|nr:hypothetical protein CEXT_601071 [Caerostris extrusa]
MGNFRRNSTGNLILTSVQTAEWRTQSYYKRCVSESGNKTTKNTQRKGIRYGMPSPLLALANLEQVEAGVIACEKCCSFSSAI